MISLEFLPGYREWGPRLDALRYFDGPLWLHGEAGCGVTSFADFLALARGCGVDKPVYSFVTHTRTGQTDRIEPSEFMIVEGLFALYHERVRELCGAKVFLAVPDRTAFERRLERDVRERGRTPESVHAQYEATVRPM